METSGSKSLSGGLDKAAADPSETIIFDTSSGISLEEQQEILDGINSMSGGTRLIPEAVIMKAKKKGFLFPLFVNIVAVILLGFGFTMLALLQVQDEQNIRDNSATLGLTERKMIQEIRRETNRQLSEKENQIKDMLSRLSEADSEYRELQVSMENLTEEQKLRAESLLVMQEEYRSTLSDLQEERNRIIDDSRMQEAILRAFAEERALELSSRIEQSQENLSAAMEELRLLNNEQERAVRAENQMAGYYAVVNDHINKNRLDEAQATLAAMKEFLSAPSLQGIRSLDARKQTHLTAIAAMEATVAETQRLMEESASRLSGTAAISASNAEQVKALQEAVAALEEQNTVLQQRTAEQERVIAAISSQGSEQSQLIAEFEVTISTLRTENSILNTANQNQQQALNQRDSEIQILNEDNDVQDQMITTLNRNLAVVQNEAQMATNRAQQNETALEEQRRQNTSLNQQIAALNEQNTTLNQQVAALNQQNTSLSQQVATLNQQNSTLNQQVATLTQQNSSQSQQITGLNQRISTLDQQVAALNQQNTTLNQQIATLNQQNSTLNQQNNTLTLQNNELQRQLDIAREAARIFLEGS